MNETIGPEGLIPNLLVFGTLPTLPTENNNQMDQQERVYVVRTARSQLVNIVAEMRSNVALKSRLPFATRFHFKPGQMIRVYRQQSRKWEGTFNIERMEGKHVCITDGKKLKRFSCTQILPKPADVADREL